jgi:hypothetical protein
MTISTRSGGSSGVSILPFFWLFLDSVCTLVCTEWFSFVVSACVSVGCDFVATVLKTDAPETTHQKPIDEKPKERTLEETKKISDEIAKGQPTEADGD